METKITDFSDIEKRLKQSSDRLQEEIPEDWQHSRSEELLEELGRLADASSSEAQKDKVIPFQFWLSNLCTAVAACLVTALVLQFGGKPNPADPVTNQNGMSAERIREIPPETFDQQVVVSSEVVQNLVLRLDNSLIERANFVLKESSDDQDYQISSARESLEKALTDYIRISMDDSEIQLASKQKDVLRWVQVLEANLDIRAETE